MFVIISQGTEIKTCLVRKKFYRRTQCTHKCIKYVFLYTSNQMLQGMKYLKAQFYKAKIIIIIKEA